MKIDPQAIIEAAAEDSFSGVVAVDVGDTRTAEHCFGFAHRSGEIPNSPTTRFAIASGSKAFTALAILRLIDDGVLRRDQLVREILGDDLPLVDDRVTIEHLLAHTSGIGDYLDESDDGEITDYVLALPVHVFESPEDFLPVLADREQKFAPGERFAYCNGGYVILALVIERVTGESFPDVVSRLVFEPAGLSSTGYPRSDEATAGTATHYLFDEGDRSNVLHLPVRGSGDGGAVTTADDLHQFWTALFAGDIVPVATVSEATRPRTEVPDEGLHYGLGFWVHNSGGAVLLEGYDAGVSFRSTHIPATQTTASVLGNWSDGAWPVIGVVAEAVDVALAAS